MPLTYCCGMYSLGTFCDDVHNFTYGTAGKTACDESLPNMSVMNLLITYALIGSHLVNAA